LWQFSLERINVGGDDLLVAHCEIYCKRLHILLKKRVVMHRQPAATAWFAIAAERFPLWKTVPNLEEVLHHLLWAR
jgi:hypothetical protein